MSVLLRRYYQLLNQNWLYPDTIISIFGAFGVVGGKEVIRNTNAYLNVLAKSDRVNAQALAGFINEDPMMVCSLGLVVPGVTMPIRWLVGDGNSWINSLYKPMTKNTKLKALLKVSSMAGIGTNGVFGCRASATSLRYNVFMNGEAQNVRPDWAKPDSDYTQYSITRDTPYEMEVKAGYFKLNNNVIYNQSLDKQSFDAYCYIFAYNNNNETAVISKGTSFAFAELLEGSEQVRNLIPFKSATREGMVNLINAAFYPNQGTGHFTDAYTLQDGVTPWTPANV